MSHINKILVPMELSDLDRRLMAFVTGMNRYGRHTLAAIDAQMRASLPAFDATEGPQDAPKVLRGHEIRIADGA